MRLLILQPTAFCNLDCHYCYLPARSERGRMKLAILRTACARLAEADVLGANLDIVWHAGEPLAVPCDWYESAFAVVRGSLPATTAVRHHVQTNGTLVDDRWCLLLARHGVRVGVSLDGPAWLHDRHRRTRAGRGTHAAALRGYRRLRAAGLRPHVIAVLTADSLDHADAMLDFCAAEGVAELGLNIEEIEGVNRGSSLSAPGVEERFRSFVRRLLARRGRPGTPRLREVENVLATLDHPDFGRGTEAEETTPFAIIAVDHRGEVATFSPELLGLGDARHGAFTYGNVAELPLAAIARDSRLLGVAREIGQGVAACASSCRFFAFCRGGAPANKLAEHGHFAGTETLFCRLTRQILVEEVLTALAPERLGLIGHSPGGAACAHEAADLPVAG